MGGRRAAHMLVVGILAMVVGLVAPLRSAEADRPDDPFAPPPEDPGGDPGIAPEPEPEPDPDPIPPDPTTTTTVPDPDPDPDPNNPPPEGVAAVNAAIEEVAEPLAAEQQKNAEQLFLEALLREVADLQARYGNAVGPGEEVPPGVLYAINQELLTFLDPYITALCKQELVLTGDLSGISEEIKQRLAFKWWYIPVFPALIGWLFFRISKCENELRSRVPSILSACSIARGHDSYTYHWEPIQASGGRSFPTSDQAWNDARAWAYAHMPNPYDFLRNVQVIPDYHCIHD